MIPDAALDREPADPVLDALAAELARTRTSALRPPDHVALRATEDRVVHLSARLGGLDAPLVHHDRAVTVDVRYGPPERDSAHPLRATGGGPPPGVSGPLPLGDAPGPLRRAIWATVEPALRLAEERLAQVEAEHAVRVDELDRSPDRSVEAPVVALHPPRVAAVDVDAWHAALAEVSLLLADPRLRGTSAALTVESRTTWVVDLDGTRVRTSTTSARVEVVATRLADDGAMVGLSRWHTAHDPADLPGPAVLAGWARALSAEVLALADAAVGDAGSGPVLLAGPAAAVWLHEVCGHRAEGHRQKDEAEGQTFRGAVGRALLPTTISLWDDPRLRTYRGQDLAGHYQHDDEGRPSERVDLVRDGVFCGFLTSRTPIEGFPRSNGHGRAQPGFHPVARMGNTVLETADPRPAWELRERLRAEAARRGHPWGLVVDRLSGGYALTARGFPNVFALSVERAWRVWADGRPDEPVRGLDVVGTPLVALSGLLAAGDDPAVFNGVCGAESGAVAVSAVSPSLLFAELEVQQQPRGQLKPPLLAPPAPVAELAPIDVLAEAVARAHTLVAPGMPAPYHVRYQLRDVAVARVEAVPGALLGDVRTVDRTLGVEVRVGTPATDSARFGLPGQDGLVALPVPPGGGATLPLARAAWTIADGAWKAAVENLARKEASRRARPPAPRGPDFVAEPAPHPPKCDPTPPPPDPEALRALARAATDPLEGADVDDVRAIAVGMTGTTTIVDSLGARLVGADVDFTLAVGALVRADDGALGGDALRWIRRRPEELDPAAVSAEVAALRARLAAWRAAPRAEEEWIGPVLVTGDAAVALVRRALLPALRATPPREWPDGPAAPDPGALRVGRRALPAGWSVVDDPRPGSGGPASPSAFRWDVEGVAAAPLALVVDGVVRALLAGRAPGPDQPHGNGRGLASPGEEAIGTPSHAILTGPAPVSDAALRADAVARAAALGFPHALEIRRFVDPATGGGPEPEALEAVLLGPGGAESPVRGLRLPGIDRRVFLDLVGAGDPVVRTVFWEHDDDGPYELVSGYPVTITTPSLLFRRLALAPDAGPPAPARVLPPPR